MNILRATSAEQAEEAIRARASAVVELDFDATADQLLHLLPLGRPNGVSIVHIRQEMILVMSAAAMRRGLQEPKSVSWRQRMLVCAFSWKTLQLSEQMLLEQLAADLGDLIVPDDVAAAPYAHQVTWH